MTDKKRRQRGSRTHGGGSSKKRRGAGHRGGRGNAGRSKHQIHGQAPLGKHGFTRPEAVVDAVATVNVGRLDEDAEALLAADLARERDDVVEIDAREVLAVDDDVDRVKVLGRGRVTRPLAIVADTFSQTARSRLEEAGGEAILAIDHDESHD